MIAYGIRSRPRYGQRSSHNDTVLPLLPVDTPFEIPRFSENTSGNNIWLLKLSTYQDLIKTESRTKLDPTESEVLDLSPLDPPHRPLKTSLLMTSDATFSFEELKLLLQCT
ncbi:hypothetical protein TNCV_2048581 [Trichonephila clavipes]|nr:hypothetical protein TNCV_2048581 [Trichonephila clavipes]